MRKRGKELGEGLWWGMRRGGRGQSGIAQGLCPTQGQSKGFR